jgi:hypothetical protein
MTMPATRYLTAVAVTLATMLLVAGCGDDAESTPPSTTVSAAPSTTAARSTTSTTLSAKAELPLPTTDPGKYMPTRYAN